jgi:peptidoglycan/xylan/chitin deacetylase (PgdA/CDA1 family)
MTRITDYPSLPSPEPDDVLPIVDVSDTSQNPAGTTKQITVGDLAAGGDVTSVFGRTGEVTAQSGDYSAGEVTGAAPLASPAFTGTPTAPTAAALTDNTQIATTAYADAGTAVEKARAQAAEGNITNLGGVPVTVAPYTSPPASPAPGSLWYDQTNYALKQYNGAGFQPAEMGGPARGYRSPDITLLQKIWMGQSSGPFTYGGGGTGSNADTSTYAIGSQSVYITSSGSGTQSKISGSFGTALNMTGQCLVVWLRVDNLTSLLGGYPRLFLGDVGLTNCYWWKVYSSPTQPWALDGEWLRITLPFGSAQVTGSPSRASLAALTIQFYDNSAGTVTVHLGGVATMPEPQAFPNGVVSLCFDDGYLSQYQVSAPQMDAYGYRGTGYLICETVFNYSSGLYGNYMTEAMIQSLEAQNQWEFGSHAFTAANHNAGYVSIGDLAALADMRMAKLFLSNILGTRAPDHFAYPLGAFDAATVANAAATFGSGRSISSIGGFPDETFPPATLPRLRSYVLSEANGIAAVPGYITEAAANREWLILTTHDVQASGAAGNLQFSLAHFQAVLADIAASGMPVLPISEVLKLGETPAIPVSQLGDTIYAGGSYTAAPARLPGNTSSQQMFYSQAGTGTASAAPAWAVVPGQKLSQVIYAPASQTGVPVTTTTMAAFSSANLNTGSFTAPASGQVRVQVNFIGKATASGSWTAFGLAAHGTVSPIVCNEWNFEAPTADAMQLALDFTVPGLTPGASCNFDLVGCSSGTYTIYAVGTTSTTPNLAGTAQGAPVTITVMAD